MESENVKIKLFDDLMGSFKVVKAFEHDDRITAMDYSPDGQKLISCSADDTIHIYNCELGRQTALLNSKKYGVDLIRFTDEGCTAIHCSTKVDDKIRYLNVNSNKYCHYFTGHAKRVISMSVSPSNNTFLSTSLDKTLRIWDLRMQDCQDVVHISGRPVAAYDPDGIVFAVAINSGSGCIKLYDTRMFGKGPFTAFKISDEKDCEWTTLKFSNDGKTILICTDGLTTLLIDAFFGTHLRTLTGKKKRFLCDSDFVETFYQFTEFIDSIL